MPQSYALAVDAGTSFVEVALVDADTGSVIGTARTPNQQAFFGTNVLTRLSAAVDGHAEALQIAVQDSILEAVGAVGQKTVEAVLARIERIVVASNAVMAPLLCGIVPEGLVTAPFTPSTIEVCDSGPLIDAWRSATGSTTCTVGVLAPIAAFVGGDARAVLVATGLNHEAEATLVVDLGTNAEILLRDGDSLFVTSVPAGPTFEGMLRSGSGGMRGSDVIDLLAERLQQGAIDPTGLVVDPESAYPLTQEDVRDFQLAKAAVRVGIDLLLSDAGIAPDQVTSFELVGAFGSALDPDSARSIGLFTPRLPEPITRRSEETAPTAHNTALRGAVMVLQGRSSAIEGSVTALELATDTGFEQAFLDALSFPAPGSE